MNILGISALYHDSAATLVHDGHIVAAAQEERFTRKKADASIPTNAIRYVLSQMDGELDAVVYYDDPTLTMDRWLQNAIMVSPNNQQIIEKSFNSMFSQRLWVTDLISEAVGGLGKYGKLLVCQHHLSHASSAFFPSPFKEAAILTMDGVGEWGTTTICSGVDKDIKIHKQINYPDSLGLLYSAFTYFCGFKVNFGEYKLMGLAPYGEPKYYDLILSELMDLKDDGSFKLNQDYFSYTTDEYMTDERFEELFKVKRREQESLITKEYMNLAASIQKVTEEVVIRLAKCARDTTQKRNLVIAGGIGLNCVANGEVLRRKIFDNVWIQPAAGDSGGSLGCALYAYYKIFGGERVVNDRDGMRGSFLGPYFSKDYIRRFLKKNEYAFLHYADEGELSDVISGYLAENKIVGLFQGRMEFGPRALGGRSIIANPKSPDMQSKLNLSIKYRESFRPFAPAVILEECANYFDIDVESPYMLFVAPVKKELRINCSQKENEEDLIKIVNQERSSIPAVTHVDYSARIQTVDKQRNPLFYSIISSFKKKTGCGVVINTSFNVRGEPIVCSPEDAYRCFMRTEMDVLILESFVLLKTEQPKYDDNVDWRNQYELD